MKNSNAIGEKIIEKDRDDVGGYCFQGPVYISKYGKKSISKCWYKTWGKLEENRDGGQYWFQGQG